MRVLLIAWLLLIGLTGDAFAQSAFVTYTVKPGDTCASIAEDAYGSASLYRYIHEANDLGEPPHILKPGTTLRLPKVAEAMLARESGRVRAKPPTDEWVDANAGLELYRAWRLNTLERARALVTFRDTSELALRENTLIVIYGASAGSTQKRSTRAELESGALRAQMAALAGQTLTVETPSSSSELGASNALVTVDEQVTTRVANHGGDPIEVRGKTGGKVAVNEGFGSKVDRGARPRPPKPLPPSPAWIEGPQQFPTFGNATVRASWEPVQKAAEYFVELTADPRGIRVIQAAVVPSSVTKLEVQNLPPGRYYATVSSIDGDKFESIPSQRRTLEVARFEFDRKHLLAATPPRILAGAPVESPNGLRCGTDDVAETFVLGIASREAATGLGYPGEVAAQTVRCLDERQTPAEVDVELAMPSFRLEGPYVDGDLVEVPVGGEAWVDVAFDGPAVPLEIDARGVTAELVQVAPSRARLTITDVDGDDDSLVLGVAGRALLNVPIAVREARVAAPVLRKSAWELGAGALVQSGARAGARMHGGIGVQRLRANLFVDVGAAFGTADEAFVGGIGFEAAVMWPLGRWRPFVGVGAEVLTAAFDGADTAFEASLGSDVYIAEEDGLRFALRAAMADGAPWQGAVGGYVGYFWTF